MKLLYKVLLLVILPITILSVATIIFMNRILHKELEQRFVENLESSTISYSLLIDAHLEKISKVADLTSQTITNNINNLSNKLILNNINPILQYDSLIFGTGVFLDTIIGNSKANNLNYVYREENQIRSIVLNKSDKEYQDIIKENPQYLSDPKQLGKGIWTSPYFDIGLSNSFLVTYSKPIYYDSTYIGIVTVDIKLRNLGKLIDANEDKIEGDYDPFLVVMNKIDSVIVYSENINLVGEYFFNYEYNNDSTDSNILKFDTIFNKASGTGLINNHDGKKNIIVSFADVPTTNWKLINLIDTSVANKIINETIFWSIVVVMIVLLFLIMIVYVNIRLLTKPISRLSGASEEISDGNYNIQIDIKSKDEIGILADNFKKMILKIQSREEELKRSNLSLKKAQNQLLKLDDAKNEFLKMISHEIRTPLNGIVGSTYFLKDMIEDPEMSEFVEMLRESVDRLDRFSKLALEITELVAQGNSTQSETFDICKNIDDVISGFKQDIDNKGLTVNTSFPQNAKINSQPGYFKRSIEELISNAIKYSFEKSTIDISVSQLKNDLILKISNTSETIDKDRIDDLTKPFGLGKEHIDKNTGLGLAFIKQYLDINNASLSINSKEEFTEIIITFKAANL